MILYYSIKFNSDHEQIYWETKKWLTTMVNKSIPAKLMRLQVINVGIFFFFPFLWIPEYLLGIYR